MLPDKLHRKLGMRHFSGGLRVLEHKKDLIDFASNDYLGFANNLKVDKGSKHGSTGSRLLSGHTSLHENVEKQIAEFHKAESALLFNSGYDANIGLISSLADRMDLIIYDSLVHASIRDGIKLSNAKAIKFHHNDLDHLEILLEKFSTGEDREVYVITESVFSMDGDLPDLKAMVELIAHYKNVNLILDEAHALGVIGEQGEGLAQHLKVEDQIFARVVTFGKGLGAHGAAVLGSSDLKSYLINFCRSFIYTTAPAEHALRAIELGYKTLSQGSDQVSALQHNIKIFNDEVLRAGLRLRFRESETVHTEHSRSAIQVCIIPDNKKVTIAADKLQAKGYDIRAIRSPTVARGQERLRICLHSYNTHDQIKNMLTLLAKILRN
ncbi:MAG: pyridoxal phosphate-dependent aminotransferase family protein [Nonlabens sp.]